MTESSSSDTEPIVRFTDVVKLYRLPKTKGARQMLHAVDGVSFAMRRGRTFGLVGESGSGKSTVARLLMRLVDTTSGSIEIGGQDITHANGRRLALARRQMQMVFQDPYSSFDPLSSIGDSIAEPIHTHLSLSAGERQRRVHELLATVGLSAQHALRYPNELSGGQLQRAAVARALTLNPSVLVLDEPVSALDVSVQAQVINLLQDLQEQLQLSYLFIAHDLSVVRHIAHDVAVMYLGRIVEFGPAEVIYSAPTHPYTRTLLAAAPISHPANRNTVPHAAIRGDIPSAIDPPSGCRFRTRCPYAMEICSREDPPPTTTSEGVISYCHLNAASPQQG